MRLVMGVIDVPYAHEPKTQQKRVVSVRGKLRPHIKKAPKPEGEPEAVTTGDVATFLEAGYHVQENFVHRYREPIVAEIEKCLTSQLESLLLGKPSNRIVYEGANSSIEHMFRQFLDNREMDGMPGVPTQAAERGVSHRFKHPYAKRAPRPSFIDTGLYQASVVAEVKEE